MQKIIPCLWFDNQAEEAVNFYVSIFKDGKIGAISRYGKEGYEIHGQPEGTVLTAEFEINGQSFTAMNGGPIFKFSEAISFQVFCDTQEEIDYYWEKMSAVPASEQCGWLKDKFGLSWQIVPSIMGKLLKTANPVQADRVMKVLLQMKKLDIAALQAAYDGK